MPRALLPLVVALLIHHSLWAETAHWPHARIREDGCCSSGSIYISLWCVQWLWKCFSWIVFTTWGGRRVGVFSLKQSRCGDVFFILKFSYFPKRIFLLPWSNWFFEILLPCLNFLSLFQDPMKVACQINVVGWEVIPCFFWSFWVVGGGGHELKERVGPRLQDAHQPSCSVSRSLDCCSWPF